MRRPIWPIALVALMALSAQAHEGATRAHAGTAMKKEQQAWGIAGEAKAVTRTIELTMSDDMRFTPGHIDIRRGQTVRFVVRNSGAVLHEVVIGTPQTLEAHAALMVKFPNMEHDEPYMAHVAPGKRGELVWQFNRAGEFDFACLIAGHYQAGMRGTITVRSSTP
ncbi:plastocyanin [Caenimonas koreensis DSM 17982]|uniref:Plastocyanin n=2 Tax=Caenimonas TaxID=763439 RepID=A0A844BBW9_9BURK|nr:cupredoxin family protein [Caenimonas koreensis]MRD49119.1 plastocyanin [Caenimonas koreensis DSM 17982]